jgi:hypothetical protein
MKTIMKGSIRDQKGAAVLSLVLILLVVGGLILTPLLGLMSTGLMAGQVYEKKTDELYAADAGVEDAIWRIGNESIPRGSWVTSDDRPDWDVYHYPKPLTVNGKGVDVVVYRKDWDYTCGENLTYQIISTAVTDDDGSTAALHSSTAVASYVDAKIVVRNLLDNAITSQGDISLGPNSIVGGDVQFGGNLTGAGSVNGTETPEKYAIWPDGGDLSDYYLGNVTGAPDPGDSYDVSGQTKTEGPWYRNGDLKIDNTVNNPGRLILGGTVYVAGNLDFQQPGGKDYTIDLNGKTIFATGRITFPEAKDKVYITGSGCIIAMGRIDFWPSISSESTDDFVFVLSTGSYIDFKPNGDFCGSLAGDVRVDLASKCHMTWTEWRRSGIDFPVADYAYASQIVKSLTIRTWEINPQ